MNNFDKTLSILTEKKYQTFPLGTVMSWGEFKRFLLTLPLKDSFGRMEDEEIKNMAAAAMVWTLTSINTETMQPDDGNPDITMPIIYCVQDGEVLDGRRRLEKAYIRGDKSIAAWVGTD